MNLNGFFDQPSPFMIKPPVTNPTGRQNKWTAQHKAQLKAKAKKSIKKVKLAKPVQAQPVAIQAAPVLAMPQAPKESFFDKIGTVIQQAAPSVLATVTAAKNQKRIDKIQQQRLEAGKELLTAEEIDKYMDATAPVVKVKGGIDNNTNKYLLMGGLGIAGLFLVMRNKPSAKNG